MGRDDLTAPPRGSRPARTSAWSRYMRDIAPKPLPQPDNNYFFTAEHPETGPSRPHNTHSTPAT
jgi:hypothetical protein